MSTLLRTTASFIGLVLMAILTCPAVGSTNESADWQVDFRYAIPWWQTAICLPDDPQKTLVGKDGELLYDFPGKIAEFQTRITFGVENATKWVKQELVSPRVPIVRTTGRGSAVDVIQEAFARTPAAREAPSPRCDIVLVRLHNSKDQPTVVKPIITIESQAPLALSADRQRADIGQMTRVSCSQSVASAELKKEKLVLRLEAVSLPAGGERRLAVSIARGKDGRTGPTDVAKIEAMRDGAERYWTDGRIPYDRIQVADAGIQALIDSSIRNIYQAREIKNGLPAFQVGPTCYRGLWIVDGTFLLEAATYFGCGDEARSGIRYMLSHQREDGRFEIIKNHWKESGIVLWAVTRHARLTGDMDWLREVWPKVERAMAFIKRMRQEASTDPKALHYRLIPPGFSDGGIGGKLAEYTNVYWTLAGMKAAIDAARWLGKTDEADGWQREYDDFYAAFRKAAQRDRRTDPHGNHYVPIAMGNVGNELPQRAQWAFCHAVFPGKIFSPDDPLVRGNMAMLEATEREGMVFGTGWADKGIWNYFASFYGHAWLWSGDGQKAAKALYAFANHASPLLAWREEQMPQGQGGQKVGDMPHNWASAEFIRLVRHMLVLERGNDLHLLEGMPAKWAKPGAVNRWKDMATEFGPMSLEICVSEDGHTARLHVDPPTRVRPDHLVLHLGCWANPSDPKAVMELPVTGPIERTITLSVKYCASDK